MGEEALGVYSRSQGGWASLKSLGNPALCESLAEGGFKLLNTGPMGTNLTIELSPYQIISSHEV